MPQPSPAQHAKPNAKAKTQHQAHTNAQHPSQGGLASLGFGKGIGSRPTLHDHCVCPFVARCRHSQRWGSKGGERRAQGGLSVGIAYVIGLVNANIAREGLEQIGFPRATKPPLSDELVPC